MKWPFILLTHHEEVCRLFEARIHDLERVNQLLIKRAADADTERRSQSGRIINILARETTTARDQFQARRPAEPINVPEERFDPTDLASCIRQAKKETGSSNARIVIERANKLRADYYRSNTRYTPPPAPPEPFEHPQPPQEILNQIEQDAEEARAAAFLAVAGADQQVQ